MVDLDRWLEIWSTLKANRLRTVLTALGVWWGIFMLVVMVAFGSSLRAGVSRNFAGLATNSVFVWGQRTSMPYGGLQPGRHVEYDTADIAALRRIEGIQYLAPRNQLGGFRGGFNVTYGTKTGNFGVMADYPEVQYVQTPLVLAGRFLDDGDLDERRKVAIIGKGVYEQLYAPGAEAIGTYIKISGVYFQVIGVTGSLRTGGEGDRDLNMITIPFTTFQQAFHAGDRVGWFAIVAKPEYGAAKIEAEVRRVLAERHKIAPDDDQAIGSFNAEKEFGKIQTVFWAIDIVLWIVGVMTLLAGMIGVSNIMLISVKERTKEIGLRKALGATPWSIVAMIVSETVALTTVAGYLGVVGGVAAVEGLGWLIAHMPDSPLGPPQIGLSTAWQATGLLVVAGLIAGLMPAAHAASIQPVEALRAE
ncbi:MAG: ABC transporter permease [Kofleriaceae bacterium]|nr:ABC transporter permease [Myxococcales bacterium]MCB9564362.1 ABC transporter permease [Kofleriaceae bacterium]MCB9575228.1 ABC transporter permease [Kofleriaceae bacterium]